MTPIGVRRAGDDSATPARNAESPDELDANKFNTRPQQSVAYTQRSGQTHCPENRDAFGGCHFGRGRLQRFSRSRGFSARGHKHCPQSGNSALRAGEEVRRTIAPQPTTMSASYQHHTHDRRTGSRESSVQQTLYNVQSDVQCTKLNVQTSFLRWSA